MEREYDIASQESILNHARRLLGTTLRGLHGAAVQRNGGKGGMGQSVESIHFGYAPNNVAKPDFEEAGVELKCTPLKVLQDGSMVSKERLVLNIIDYVEESRQTFHTSSFWKKNKVLLLMFYLHQKGVDVVDLLFKIVRLWNFPETDLKIIRDDWEKIHWKIRNGLAHEISEGDTLYLGACTKGSRAGAEMRRQAVDGAPMAQQRAYSIKSKYLNAIVLDSLAHPEMCDGVGMSDAQGKKIRECRRRIESIVKDIGEYRGGETFEQHVERRFAPYYGKSVYEIENFTGREISSSPKAMSNSVIHAILRVKTPKIAEFEKAGIQQKSIRLEPDGKLRESMAFSQIDYRGIVREAKWEDSVWYRTLTQRFLFVVFRKDRSGDNKMATLEKVFFWAMPHKDLAVAAAFWADTRSKIAAGEFGNFWKISDHRICHVRPKARNNADRMPAPDGSMVTKKGYWLNAEYILEVVNGSMGNLNESMAK